MSLSDKSFITQFEQLSLDPVEFSHLGHLRLAWLYLNQYPHSKAIKKISIGIKNYATHLGATTKYHCTLTVATSIIISYRIKQFPVSDFQQFINQNDDLANQLLNLLSQYYSNVLLNSESARKAFIKPDLQALPSFN